VHKVIVCSQSKFFSAACDNEMLVNGVMADRLPIPFYSHLICRQEKKTNTITLKEDIPDVVRAMLQFLYTFDYDDGIKFADSMEPLSFNTHVYAIADKYDIHELKELAKDKFEGLVKEQWKEDAFPEALRAVYETTPVTDRGLRDIAAQVAYDNITELMSDDSAFGRLLGDVAALGADLATLLATRGCNNRKYKCGSCKNAIRIDCLKGGPTAGYCFWCGKHQYDWRLWAR